MDIRIEWLYDECKCSDCGTSYATGAEVFIGGTQIFKFTPRAHCFDGSSWTEEEVYEKVFKYLGYTLT